jgi:hypothetical protein
MIDISKEELEARIKATMKEVAPLLSRIMKSPELLMPAADCMICMTERKQDLVAHGPRQAVFVYHPCKHRSVHMTGKPTLWYDGDELKLEVENED